MTSSILHQIAFMYNKSFYITLLSSWEHPTSQKMLTSLIVQCVCVQIEERFKGWAMVAEVVAEVVAEMAAAPIHKEEE